MSLATTTAQPDEVLRLPINVKLAAHVEERRAGLEIVGLHVTEEQQAVIVIDHLPDADEEAEIVFVVGENAIVKVVAEGVFQELDRRSREAVLNSHQAGNAMEILITDAIKAGASDIHLASGSQPWFRVGKLFQPHEGWGAMDDAEIVTLAGYVCEDIGDRIALSHEVDFSFSAVGRRVRGNMLHQRDGSGVGSCFGLALRLLPASPPWSRDLDLPTSIIPWTELPRGLVLFVGPTGSGKSTTMASLLDKINRTQQRHIITIEDPVEYQHRTRKCMVRQREVGGDTHNFADALRGALREDPDIILVGEMRDAETARIAIQAAETGHLVFSTLHTPGIVGSMNRLAGFFSGADRDNALVQIAAAIKGMCFQALVPDAHDPKRRHLVCEIMHMTPAIANLVREGNTAAIQTELQNGIDTDSQQPYELGLARAVHEDKIDAKDAIAQANAPDTFRSYLASIRQRDPGRH